MRTEDDLRAALTSLEVQAPAAARVLPGMSPRRRKKRPHRPSTRWVAGIAVTAAVVGAVTAVTVTDGTWSSTQNGAVASPSSVASPTVQAKLLAAISSAADDVVYSHVTNATTSASGHASGGDGGVWTYPAQPSPGQQVRSRDVERNGAGQVIWDTETSYAQPAPGAKPALPASAKKVEVYYPGKTWGECDGTTCAAAVSAAEWVTQVATALKQQHGKEIGSGTVDGHRAIEFAFPHVTIVNGSMDLWVDASTYLPVRLTITATPVGSPAGSPGTLSSGIDFQFLPSTAANLAWLTTKVPDGFKRVPISDVSKPAYAQR